MTSQTARRSDNQPPARTTKKKYTRQTAHVEARRDGKPLIFGWGGHLSHTEKIRLQQRAVWFLTIFIVVLLVAVSVLYWVNINVISPGLAITTVNGQSIPQSDYRKMVAVKAQLQQNDLYGPHGLTAQRDSLKDQVTAQQKIIDDSNKQITELNNQIKALPAGPSTQRTDLSAQLTAAQKKLADAQSKHDALDGQYQTMIQATIPAAQQLFSQGQVGNDSIDWLQTDVLMRQWLAKQSADIRAQIEPAPSAITRAVNDFTKNLPSTTSYAKFLSDDHVSESDVQNALAVQVRRDNLQKYLAAHTTSPTYQVHVRAMTFPTDGEAKDALKQLQQNGDFATIAKKSADTDTNTKGGDVGWLARYQYALDKAQKQSIVVDNWIFDPARKVKELSPILSENGTSHIVQIMEIDRAHPVDAAKLKDLQDNALLFWTLVQKALPGASITTADQGMLTNPANMPPGLPSSAPAPQVPGGFPGGLPGGLPGQ
ncbi:MAG: hypothetical protein E6J34_07050 [Chloroflexi bacterium]|nr:MAG: hypothetical protein E6J34_07050 [Chloroflexota bacterium]